MLAAATSAVVCSGALSGCSVSRDDEPKAAPTTESTTPTAEIASATPTPTASPSPSTPAPTPSPTPTAPATPTAPTAPTATTSRAATATAALLSAAEFPQLNQSSTWTQRRSGAAGQKPFGLCQQFDLASIGATSAVERTFSSGRDSAGQQVAEFPDAKNALRASKVIEAWHRKCPGQVKGSSVKVRPIKDVAVPSGKAWTYLVSYERAGSGHFHSLGVVLSGTRLSLLRIDHEGQDHNYPPGKDPMNLAVKAEAARLG